MENLISFRHSYNMGGYWRYSLRGHSPKGGKVNGTSYLEGETP